VLQRRKLAGETLALRRGRRVISHIEAIEFDNFDVTYEREGPPAGQSLPASSLAWRSSRMAVERTFRAPRADDALAFRQDAGGLR
jgi:hypothetical protein